MKPINARTFLFMIALLGVTLETFRDRKVTVVPFTTVQGGGDGADVEFEITVRIKRVGDQQLPAIRRPS